MQCIVGADIIWLSLHLSVGLGVQENSAKTVILWLLLLLWAEKSSFISDPVTYNPLSDLWHCGRLMDLPTHRAKSDFYLRLAGQVPSVSLCLSPPLPPFLSLCKNSNCRIAQFLDQHFSEELLNILHFIPNVNCIFLTKVHKLLGVAYLQITFNRRNVLLP